MLSRIAENVYWVGRYVERADDTVRLVATQYYGNLQVGSSHDRLLPDDLLAVLGHPPAGEDLSSLRSAVARRAGHGYLTIAVGRDDGDVSPTSGTFEADYPGRLSSSKRVGVTAVEYGLSRG